MIGLLLACLALGALAGLMAGLLGIGGGLIIVPVLLGLFAWSGNVDQAIATHLAIGTSLGTIVITALSSVRAHHRRGAVRWEIVAHLAPGIVLGALASGLLAGWIDSGQLQRIFAILVLLIAAQMAFELHPTAQHPLPGRRGMTAVGVLIGAISALVGIGGGSLSVPFLSACGMAMRQAVATAAACGLPIAVAGVSGFILSGLQDTRLPAWSIGYVHLPALLAIGTTSVLTAPMGAHLAHTLPRTTLKRVFAAFLLLVGLGLLMA